MFEKFPDLMNVEELREALGGSKKLGKDLTYELLRSNQIKSVKIGRDYKIPKPFVLEYLGLKAV